MGVVLRTWARGQLPPFQRIKIDPKHPLANGLIACYLPGISGGINIVGGGGDLTLGTAHAFDVSREGPGAQTLAANQGLSGLAPPAFKNITDGFSLYWRGFINGINSSNSDFCDLFGIDWDNAGSPPFIVANLFYDNAAIHDVHCGWNSNGTFELGGSIQIDQNAVNGWGGTFKVAGNIVLYKNGVAVDTNSGSLTQAPLSTATSTISLATTSGNPGRYLNGISNIACMWSRELSADEMALMDADPYGFLIPDENELPALIISGGNASPSITGQQLTATAGSITERVDDSATLTGLQLTASPGSVTPTTGTAVNIAGIQLTATPGSITERVDDSATLTGLQLTSAAGSITETVDDSSTLTGLQLTSAAGSITERVDDSVTLSGIQLTASAGTVTPTAGNVVSIPGLQLTSAAGLITDTITSNITLTGQQLTASAGTIIERVDDNATLTGLQLTSAAGSITERVDDFATLLGLQLAAIAGNISTSGTSSPTIGIIGQQLNMFAGSITVNINNGGVFIRSPNVIMAHALKRRIIAISTNRRLSS